MPKADYIHSRIRGMKQKAGFDTSHCDAISNPLRVGVTQTQSPQLKNGDNIVPYLVGLILRIKRVNLGKHLEQNPGTQQVRNENSCYYS